MYERCIQYFPRFGKLAARRAARRRRGVGAAALAPLLWAPGEPGARPVAGPGMCLERRRGRGPVGVLVSRQRVASFPELHNRTHLWKLLACFTARQAFDLARKESRRAQASSRTSRPWARTALPHLPTGNRLLSSAPPSPTCWSACRPTSCGAWPWPGWKGAATPRWRSDSAGLSAPSSAELQVIRGLWQDVAGDLS